MSRPRKCRRVCSLPKSSLFGPLDIVCCNEKVVLAIDEYETLRLIDLAGYTQEECAEQMGVARTTVQGVYNEARRKVADALVHGKNLFISGGEYDLCEGMERPCGRKCNMMCCKKDEENEKI